jgi:aminomuconate-semialdehyde/2-hydroxymuconate-6-semialdehyde dehydrogenase
VIDLSRYDVRNYVGGRFVPAASGATLEVLEPGTGRAWGQIPESGPADVDAAVAAAHAAQPAWAATPAAERADLLDAVADRLAARFDELAECEARDAGKPIETARAMDIPRAIANFRFFAGAVRHDQAPFFEGPRSFHYTLRRPLGVVALITPWNLPLYLLSWKVAPALATGNAVVAKPSELTPLTASLLASILHELGAPAGVFNLLHGTGGSVGAPLVGHPGVHGVSFTGGTVTGERVAQATATRFVKTSLELGGKNPTLVFADADLDQALEGAVRAAFRNTGQICLCGSRLFVQRSVFDAFVPAFVARVRALRQGAPLDPDARVAAVISAAHRDKVDSYVALGRAEGGTVACGGEVVRLPPPHEGGFYYAPTVITGLPPTARAACEEIFGPVVTVHPFDDEDEAVRAANGVRYGLSASVWTRDLYRAHRVAKRLDSGIVWVNTWLDRDLRTPFGGVKDSGLGREGGAWSLAFYTEEKNVTIATG